MRLIRSVLLAACLVGLAAPVASQESGGCCRLEGEWQLELTMDSAAGVPRPAVRTRGPIVFSERIRPRYEWERFEPGTEQGRSGVDLGVLFGEPVQEEGIHPWALDLFRSAMGMVLEGDSVLMAIVPETDMGAWLEGTLRGDTVLGRWGQNAERGARGSFVMHRVSPTPAGNRLVEDAVRAIRDRRAQDKRDDWQMRQQAGSLRLRVWDEGAGRYVTAGFALRAHGDDADYVVWSGEEGWGEAVDYEAGRYDLFLYRYPCGDQLRIADGDAARTPRATLSIVRREQVDQEIRLDLCAIRPFVPAPKVEQVIPGVTHPPHLFDRLPVQEGPSPR